MNSGTGSMTRSAWMNGGAAGRYRLLCLSAVFGVCCAFAPLTTPQLGTRRTMAAECRAVAQGAARWQMKGGGRGKGGQRSTAGSSSSSKAWLNEHVNDHWVKEAQRQGWRSRAAFKLLQLQEKHSLIRPGNLVIDLGSAPGSWTQVSVCAPMAEPWGCRLRPMNVQEAGTGYLHQLTRTRAHVQVAAKLVGREGIVVASDILEMKPVPGVAFIQGDFTEDAVRGEIALALQARRADVVLSDMVSGVLPSRALGRTVVPAWLTLVSRETGQSTAVARIATHTNLFANVWRAVPVPAHLCLVSSTIVRWLCTGENEAG